MIHFQPGQETIPEFWPEQIPVHPYAHNNCAFILQVEAPAQRQ